MPKEFLLHFFTPVVKVVDKILQVKNFIAIIRDCGGGIGDHVAMTTILPQLEEKYKKKIIVLSDQKPVFENNPRVRLCFNTAHLPEKVKFIISQIISKNHFKAIFEFAVPLSKYASFEEKVKTDGHGRHLAEIYSMHFGFNLKFDNVHAEMFLSKEEEQRFLKKFDFLKPDTYAVTHSIGKMTYTPNKDWGKDKLQKIINLGNGMIRWVQVGLKTDPQLAGAVDLRGRTDIRELAFVLKNAAFIVCQEGLYTHMADAVGTRCYTIYSGFLFHEISSYPSIIPIWHRVPCAPCWLKTPCPYNKECLESIRPEKVWNIIKQKEKL